MSETKTITVNGRHYDAHSGLAVDTLSVSAAPSTELSVAKPAHRSTPHATAMHSRTQRSHTLNRKALAKPHKATPVHVNQPEHKIITRPQVTQHIHVAKAQPSKAISRFAPHPAAAPTKRVMDIGPIAHPHVVKAHAISKAKASVPQTQAPSVPHKTAHEVKQTAIHQAIANTSVNHSTASKGRLLKRHPRALSIISASFAIVLLGGYLTYLNMPSLSVRVAAAQSGINASYPNYQPDGYSLNGLVGYSEGKVTMKFASNGGPSAFTINQAKSNWDSVAVLDNYVSPRAGASYIPYTERGLTIYTYGNNAAWVNGGILYTIEGNAPLSSEQIRRIATSLI
ncbi:hypothetical protein HY312_03825 [Candidatus Saccharibacteria bacterium]|nr:hypothetical protein [Candidatus Saccharibacteria bacterium]